MRKKPPRKARPFHDSSLGLRGTVALRQGSNTLNGTKQTERVRVKKGLSRDRLVTIAHEFVKREGLDALTMRRLAHEAEVSPGALYKHVRDRRDLLRAMAESVFAAVDLDGLTEEPSAGDRVVACCQRLRAGMLAFRDGGRIVAGAYSPSIPAIRISQELHESFQVICLPDVEPGELVLVLRSYVTAFVIEEQAYLELVSNDEWSPLVRAISATGHVRTSGRSDIVAIMTGDRDERFISGLRIILRGVTDTQL